MVSKVLLNRGLVKVVEDFNLVSSLNKFGVRYVDVHDSFEHRVLSGKRIILNIEVFDFPFDIFKASCTYDKESEIYYGIVMLLNKITTKQDWYWVYSFLIHSSSNYARFLKHMETTDDFNSAYPILSEVKLTHGNAKGVVVSIDPSHNLGIQLVFENQSTQDVNSKSLKELQDVMKHCI